MLFPLQESWPTPTEPLQFGVISFHTHRHRAMDLSHFSPRYRWEHVWARKPGYLPQRQGRGVAWPPAVSSDRTDSSVQTLLIHRSRSPQGAFVPRHTDGSMSDAGSPSSTGTRTRAHPTRSPGPTCTGQEGHTPVLAALCLGMCLYLDCLVSVLSGKWGPTTLPTANDTPSHPHAHIQIHTCVHTHTHPYAEL